MSLCSIKLLDINIIVKDIKAWILDIKRKYQIHEYSYSNNFYLGTYNKNPVILIVTTIPPKPLIEYSIDVNPQQKEITDYLNNIINLTRLI